MKRGFVPCTGLSVIEDPREHENDTGKPYDFELLVQEAAMHGHAWETLDKAHNNNWEVGNSRR